MPKFKRKKSYKKRVYKRTYKPKKPTYKRKRATSRKKTYKATSTRRKRPKMQLAIGSDKWLQNSIGFFRTNKVVNMKWEKSHILPTAVEGAFSPNRFICMNDISNPDYAVTPNTRPIGYDTWAMFFSRYQVIGAIMKTTFRWATVKSSDAFCRQPTVVYCVPNTGSFVQDSIQHVRELYGPCTKVLQQDVASQVTITTKFSMKKFFPDGVKVSVQARTGAMFGASPTYRQYTAVGACGMSDSYVVAPIQADSKLFFHVRLMLPKELEPTEAQLAPCPQATDDEDINFDDMSLVEVPVHPTGCLCDTCQHF